MIAQNLNEVLTQIDRIDQYIITLIAEQGSTLDSWLMITVLIQR